MDITLVNTSKIKSNPDNPRLIKDDKFMKLVKSIQEFPQMLQIRPIVVNSKMVVLGGNMRLKACKEAGLKQVYIIHADNLTEEQQKEFIVKDNASFGEWDTKELKTWDTKSLSNWGVDIERTTQSYDVESSDYNEEEEEGERNSKIKPEKENDNDDSSQPLVFNLSRTTIIKFNNLAKAQKLKDNKMFEELLNAYAK